MERTVRHLMERYGQAVELLRAGEKTPARAFLQAVTRQREEERQLMPTPLGLRREDQFLYLGPSELALKAGEDRVSWNGQDYLVQMAQPIYVRGEILHWWAVLIPADKEETWAQA